MDSEEELAFFLSSLSYQDPSQRKALLESSAFGSDYSINEAFNSDEFVSVHSRDGQHVYNAHRGSANMDDFTTDLQLAVGGITSTKRHRRSRQWSHEVRQHHGNHVEYTEVGHSLGGTLADDISRQYGDKSIVFNMGTSPLHKDHEGSEEHKQLRIGNDIVSSFNASSATKTIAYQPQNPLEQLIQSRIHSISDFLPEQAGPSPGAALSLYSSIQGHFLSNFSQQAS